MTVDWFERLTGFAESSYDETKARLQVGAGVLTSKANGRAYKVGRLTLPSLSDLRAQTASVDRGGRLRFSNVTGDVRALHRAPEYAGAVFQVASQFNMLEMVAPSVTPERGVTRYITDRTQGPACAIAAGAATIYRNYYALVGGRVGQTRDHQLDGLAELGDALSHKLGRPKSALYEMRNGYALGTTGGVNAIAQLLRDCGNEQKDALRASLRIGLHQDVEVTDGEPPGPLVSQAFCSALPVSYSHAPGADWGPFATLVLEAAYEATMLAGVLNMQRGASNVVLLTRLGGGAFGNADEWIDQAITRALAIGEDFDLDVRLVSYGAVPQSMRAIEANLS